MTYSTRQRAFTLIELLVVISIIALLVALLLPAMDRARQAAINVICAANQKGIALAIVTYADEHEDSVPPGHDGSTANRTWPTTLMPWTGDENVYNCRTQLGGLDRHNSYVANGYYWGFWAQWLPGAQPTFLNTLKQPSNWAMIVENTEDITRAQNGQTNGCAGIYPCPNGPSYQNADYQMKLNYFPSGNPASKAQGGRHFRGGGGGGRDPWGFDNISFADGHVGSFSMEDIVTMNLPTHWYEYPFVPAAAEPSGTGTPNAGPQPGAEWWMAPHW